MTGSHRPSQVQQSAEAPPPEHGWRDRQHRLVRLHDIAPEPVRWLSPGRIAAGKITLLDGDPGLGKSTLLCEFAACVTRGELLPGGEPRPPGFVVIMSAEDDVYDTIRPRIDAAGGDPRLALAFANHVSQDAVAKPLSLPDNVDLLVDLVAGASATLLVIDPLFAFLSRNSANSEQSVRRALVALRGLAERTGVAVVAVRHLNKSGSANPLYRGGGSIGVIGSARCGLLLSADPDDPDRRILAATKGNLGPPPPSLAFRLVPVPGAGVARIAWEGESGWTAADLLQSDALGSAAGSMAAAAREWLRAELATGPRPAKELLRDALDAGFGRNAIYAARRAEGIVIRKERVPGGHWVWSHDDGRERPPAAVSREVREVR